MLLQRAVEAASSARAGDDRITQSVDGSAAMHDVSTLALPEEDKWDAELRSELERIRSELTWLSGELERGM